MRALVAVAVCAGMVGAYVALSVARGHSVDYLNGIFEMKNPSTPIWVSQPYIYIANNFDNFNRLVEDLPAHTLGLRMFYPVFALSGVKFAFPQFSSFPLYVTKTELTTLTMFYDAYYDFGLVGVAGLSALLGCCSALLDGYMGRSVWQTTSQPRCCSALPDGYMGRSAGIARTMDGRAPGVECKEPGTWQNPAALLFYGQFAVYLMLSFFTTWFSNPATWFYFAVTAILWLSLDERKGKTR